MTQDPHFYEPAQGHGLAHDPFNAIVGPRPIGWVSTQGVDGSVNLAPYSFFNAFNYHPPLIGFSSVTAKHTLRNARETGAFVWNLATRDLAAPMNATSVPAPYGTDEFALADIFALRGWQGQPADAWLVMGEVIGVHIARHLLVDGVFDTFGARIIQRGGGATAYAEIRADSRFDLERPRG